MRFNAVYVGLCPNCMGDISLDRLLKGLPCDRCLPDSFISGDSSEVIDILSRFQRLYGLKWLKILGDEFSDFSKFFESRLGFKLWGAQTSWAKRLLSLESFAIIAPTGVGKTTLLIAYVAFRAERYGWRILYVTPTENLARQVGERLAKITSSVIVYYSSMPRRIREDVLNKISSGDYRVLVVTTSFLEKRFKDIALRRFNLIVVDDVDSLMRDSRNIDRILILLGFSEETIRTALELIKVKLRLSKIRASNPSDIVEKLEYTSLELESKLRRLLQQTTNNGQLIVASATGRPRGYRHLVFRELLNFEVGGGSDYIRNIIDSYIIDDNTLDCIVKLVKSLGPGGLIFVSQYLGKSYIDQVVVALRRNGIRVEKAIAGSWRSVLKLERGDIDVIVSIASRYGVAVRGLDAPRAIKYTIFIGVPARKIRVEDALLNPMRLTRVLIQARDEGVSDAQSILSNVSKTLEKVSDYSMLLRALRRGEAEGLMADTVNILINAYRWATSWLKRKLLESREYMIGTMLATHEGLEDYIYIPDVLTYIQASGRASRLLDGKMTLGLSIIIESRLNLVRALESRLQLYSDSKIIDYSTLNIESIKKTLEDSRSGNGREFNVKSSLVIVESPTKARTIAWFWGRPGKKRIGRLIVYETSMVDDASGNVILLQITASRGHIFELVENLNNSRYGVIVNGSNSDYIPIYGSIKRCKSCGYQFISSTTCPRCGSSEVFDSKIIVEALRRLALTVDEIIIATDPDREGEKIAFDIYLTLKAYNQNIRRVVIREVTKREFTEALKNATLINIKLVESQIARRISDRLIGYTLSDYLKNIYGYKWLGAGRVQSPVLGWIIERFNAWANSMVYKVCFKLKVGYNLCLPVESKSIAESIALTDNILVSNVAYLIEDLSPPPPYTTDTLLYDASNKLGLNAERSMRIAQDLFESGLITYHRTDSTRVSQQGILVAKNYLEERGLQEYFKPRVWSSSGAHECIRPTKPLDLEGLEKALSEGTLRIPIRLTWQHKALYDAIFRRFIASQMIEAKAIKSIITLTVGSRSISIEEIGDFKIYGFTRVYGYKIEPWTLTVKQGDSIEVLDAKIFKSSLSPLYTSGDIVKIMKEKNVGRPSTYHKAIEANKRHGYIVESKKRKLLIPTKLGLEVYSILKNKFNPIISEDYTRLLEEKLDMIEVNSVDPKNIIRELWNDLEKYITTNEDKVS
ncbi:MAG: reverse gyrase [Acidilobaceae archaeon]